MMTSRREGRSFLSHPHTNNGFHFLLTTKYLMLYWKNIKRLPENPVFAEIRHNDVISTLRRHGPTCGQCATDVPLFVFYLSNGLVRVYCM